MTAITITKRGAISGAKGPGWYLSYDAPTKTTLSVGQFKNISTPGGVGLLADTDPTALGLQAVAAGVTGIPGSLAPDNWVAQAKAMGALSQSQLDPGDLELLGVDLAAAQHVRDQYWIGLALFAARMFAKFGYDLATAVGAIAAWVAANP